MHGEKAWVGMEGRIVWRAIAWVETKFELWKLPFFKRDDTMR